MQKRQWAEEAAQKLQVGLCVQIRPKGRSMEGKISEGDLVTLEPYRAQDLAVGDIVLVRISGRRYSHIVLHLIHEVGDNGFLIGNNLGRMDGWVQAVNIFGRVTTVESAFGASD